SKRDWSSDVCSSDLDELAKASVLDHHGPGARGAVLVGRLVLGAARPVEVAGVSAVGVRGTRQEFPEAATLVQELAAALGAQLTEIGRASCRERGEDA